MAISKVDYNEAPLFIKQRTDVTYGTLTASGIKHWHKSDFTHGKAWPTYTISNNTVINYYPAGITLISAGSRRASLAYLNVGNLINDDSYVAAINNNYSSDISSGTFTFDAIYVREDQYGVLQNDGTIFERGTTNIKTGKPLIIYKRYTYAYTSLGTDKSLSITGENLGFMNPPGYQVFSITGLGSGAARVSVSSADPNRSMEQSKLVINNAYSSSQSHTAYLCVTYIDEDFIQLPSRRHITVIENNNTNTTVLPSTFPIIGEEVSYNINQPDSSHNYRTVISGYKDNVMYGYGTETESNDSTIYSTITKYGDENSFTMSDINMTMNVYADSFTSFCLEDDFRPDDFYPPSGTYTQTITKDALNYSYRPQNYIYLLRGWEIGNGDEATAISMMYPNDSANTTLAAVVGFGSDGLVTGLDLYTTLVPKNLVDDQRGV